MNERPWLSGPPARVLLATDLSARCDRALDRAAQLANEWQAGFVVVNVRETPQDPDQVLRWAVGKDDVDAVVIARQQLQRDLAGLNISADMHIASGDVPAGIRSVADKTECGLVVTGMARSEALGRFLIGSTVQNLARNLSVPLLVVRNRAREAYRRIVIATDFSESSRHALQSAVRLFPDRELMLYHAHTAPLSEVVPPDTSSSACLQIKMGECAEFLDSCELSVEKRNLIKVVVEPGPIEMALAHFVRLHDMELVIVGSHGRSGLMSTLLGSVSSSLLEWLPCDTLVVREPRAVS